MSEDPALRSTKATLWDLTGAQAVFEPGDATRLAVLAQKVFPVADGTRQVAVVGNHHTVHIVFELFTSVLLRDTRDFRYFEDISSANQWLQFTVDGGKSPLPETEKVNVFDTSCQTNTTNKKNLDCLP